MNNNVAELQEKVKQLEIESKKKTEVYIHNKAVIHLQETALMKILQVAQNPSVTIVDLLKTLKSIERLSTEALAHEIILGKIKEEEANGIQQYQW